MTSDKEKNSQYILLSCSLDKLLHEAVFSMFLLEQCDIVAS